MLFKLKVLVTTLLITISRVEGQFITVNWNISTDVGKSDHERDYKYPMYQEVAPVPCDLTTSCDPFCCQDPDCDEYEISQCFQPSDNCSGFLSFLDCNCVTLDTPEWLSSFCYVYKNPIYLGKFFKTPRKIEKLGTLKNIIHTNTLFRPKQNKGAHKVKPANALGAPVMTYVQMTNLSPSVAPLLRKTPVKDSTYACTSSSVSYRLNETTICLAKITREMCQNGHKLGVMPYLVQSSNSSTHKNVPVVLRDPDFLEGVKTEIVFTCVESKLKVVGFRKQDVYLFQEGKVEACSPSVSAYRTALVNDTCLNVLVYVQYQFIVNGSDVVKLKLEYGLTNISLPVESTNNRNHKYIYLKQKFSAHFFDVMHNSNKSQARNGDVFNRGYFIGEELNFGYKLISNSSTHWKKGVLGVFGKGGSCDGSSPIPFGFHLFSVCRIRRRFSNCTQLRKAVEEIFEALLQGDSLAAHANLRPPYNRTVPLLRNYLNVSEGVSDGLTRCSVPAGQKVLVQYTSIPTESGRLIHRVIGLRVDRTLQNISLTDAEIQLTTHASFFHVSSPKEKPLSRFWEKMVSRELSENSWFNFFNAFDEVSSVEREEITFWCTALTLSAAAAVFLCAKDYFL